MNTTYVKLGDAKAKIEKVTEDEIIYSQKTRDDSQESKDIECLPVSNKNCLEIEKSFIVGETDDMFMKLEEENMKVGEQLKWKREQFKHLEEVHCLKEWELEKSTLLDEISSLQNQLHICKQALAYEKCQRKHLEIEVSNLKVRFGDASSEYQNAKSQLDSTKSEEDKDIEDLTHAMRTQEAPRELQDAQIQEAKSSHSLSILRSNLRGLEKAHKECLSIFKARHAGWSFQMEQLTGTISSYKNELETKAATIEKLKMEFECSHSLTTDLMLLNEEVSMMLLEIKLETSEALLKLSSDNQPDKDMEMLEESTKSQMEIYLEEQLKNAYDALDKANIELNERTCEQSKMEFELQMWKTTAERLKKDLEENIAMRKALENSLLTIEDFSESPKKEETAPKFKQELGVREETKAPVLANEEIVVSPEAIELEERYLKIIKEKEKILEEFQKEVLRLKQELRVREETKASVLAIEETAVSSEAIELEKRYLRIIKEKEKILEEFQKEVLRLKQELGVREETKASVVATEETTVSSEIIELEGRCLSIIEEKEKILEEFQKEVLRLEQKSFRRESERAVVAIIWKS